MMHNVAQMKTTDKFHLWYLVRIMIGILVTSLFFSFLSSDMCAALSESLFFSLLSAVMFSGLFKMRLL